MEVEYWIYQNSLQHLRPFLYSQQFIVHFSQFVHIRDTSNTNQVVYITVNSLYYSLQQIPTNRFNFNITLSIWAVHFSLLSMVTPRYWQLLTHLSSRWCGGSCISWTICKWLALCSGQLTMPAPHHSIFYGSDALCDTQPTVYKVLMAVDLPTVSRKQTVMTSRESI